MAGNYTDEYLPPCGILNTSGVVQYRNTEENANPVNCSNTPQFVMPNFHMGFTINMYALQCTKDCFIIFIITILGMILNPICAVALARERCKFPTTFLLQVLAAADTLFLLANFLSLSLPCWMREFGLKPTDDHVYVYFDHIVNIFLEIFRDYAVWMVVIVTINRYMGIYYPLKAIHLNKRVIFSKTVGALIYCIAFNIPKIFERGLVTVDDGNSTQSPKSRGLLTKNVMYTTTYFFVDTVLNVLLPIVLVSGLNMRMIQVVRRAWIKRLDLSCTYRADQDRNNRTTLMLVAIALVFVICELPHAIFLMAKVIIEPNPYSTEKTFQNLQTLILLSDISTMFQNLNSVANFFIYYLIGKMFRRILADLCCGLCCCDVSCCEDYGGCGGYIWQGSRMSTWRYHIQSLRQSRRTKQTSTVV